MESVDCIIEKGRVQRGEFQQRERASRVPFHVNFTEKNEANVQTEKGHVEHE